MQPREPGNQRKPVKPLAEQHKAMALDGIPTVGDGDHELTAGFKDPSTLAADRFEVVICSKTSILDKNRIDIFVRKNQANWSNGNGACTSDNR